MKDVFARHPLTKEEIISITAYIGSQQDIKRSSSELGYFALFGAIGAAGLFVLAHFIWIKRFRNVRKTMVGD